MFLERRSGAWPAEWVLLFALFLGTQAGAQSVKLNGPLARSRAGDVAEYLITDGGRVVYRADQAQDNRFELFSCPLAGGAAPLRLNAALPAGRSVSVGPLAAAGERIVYVASAVTASSYELFSVPADGSASPTALSGPASGVGVINAWIAAGNTALYVAFTASGSHLFRVPVDGSAPPLDLTPGLVVGGNYATQVWIAPAGDV